MKPDHERDRSRPGSPARRPAGRRTGSRAARPRGPAGAVRAGARCSALGRRARPARRGGVEAAARGRRARIAPLARALLGFLRGHGAAENNAPGRRWRLRLAASNLSAMAIRLASILSAVLLAALLRPGRGAAPTAIRPATCCSARTSSTPTRPPVAAPVQRTLNAETAAAKRAGFPLKVALIASPIDLGVIPDLFGKPQPYADFLDQEISFQGKQPLLVVMAAGYGVAGLRRPGASAARGLPKPPGRQDQHRSGPGGDHRRRRAGRRVRAPAQGRARGPAAPPAAAGSAARRRRS